MTFLTMSLEDRCITPFLKLQGYSKKLETLFVKRQTTGFQSI